MGNQNTGWGAMLRDGNLPRCLVIGGGMVLHATNTFIATTIMPSVVREIGGLAFYAWATTLYIVASLIGGATCARILARIGPRRLYMLAMAIFAAGGLLAGAAPDMATLLAGRTIQGLGAGTLSALSFTMVRVLFAPPLWPRAMAVVSASWGIATLAGPAVGGVFAEYGAWRAAFWSMAAITPALLLLVLRSLPRDLSTPPAPGFRLAKGNLALLALSVLAVSIAGALASPAASAACLAVAIALIALFIRAEAAGPARLLPTGACNPATKLGANFAAMALLIMATTVELFVPYFLQTLHNVRPLHAGYLAALASLGWTLGSVFGSGATGARARLQQRAGPLTMLAGVITLLVITPAPASALSIPLISAGLLALGLGIGMAWPHLGARVFALAPQGERDIAAGSITVIIMVGNAFGSAIGGLVTSLAGMTQPGGAAQAATALFACYTLTPVLALLMIRRLLTAPPQA